VSGHNLEIVRGCFEAFNRGDIEAALDAMDPEIQWVGEDWGSRALYHGHAGVRDLHALLQEAFDEIR
jgi:ketosteroid isomerase-like protein